MLIENCAAPPDTAEEPAVAPSIAKVTVPVWVPLTAEDTDAVNVTVFPAVEGFRLVARVVEVEAGVTDWIREGEELEAKFASPL